MVTARAGFRLDSRLRPRVSHTLPLGTTPHHHSIPLNAPAEFGANPTLVHTTWEFKFPRGEDYLDFMHDIPNDGLIRLKGILNALAEVLVARTYEFPKPGNSGEHGLLNFAFRQIKTLHPLFWDKAVKMTQTIEAGAFADTSLDEANGRTFGVTDAEDWVRKATLDIIGVAGLGRDFNILEHSNDTISSLYAELTSN
ncbi:uncharacterized protein PV07_08682 [Cladophialophora immunda]|uniref:Uncharacterized protein n=1 Tax=Cladophialophora immunda TaxID=569365 RepID=A0A0D1ZCS9_9EURO|nr:uncharacterized protein PV07_08682 [Cladophialophora immunda]KIW25516.1 hypothetical protein PV07_08682 [Cladophialophora immunda]